MNSIQLPERFKRSLRIVASLTDAQMSAVIAALGKIEPSILDNESCAHFSRDISGISSADAKALIDALLSVSVAGFNAGRKVEELVDDVVRTLMPELRSEDISIPSATPPESLLRQRLLDLLSVGALETCAKATGLQLEHPHVYVTSRVVTDLRPVFDKDIGSDPAAVLLLHSLKIEFMEAGRPNEIYIALDGQDLVRLIETLQRAMKKQETLERVLSSKKLRIVA